LSKSDGLSWENKPVFITLPAGMYYFSTTGNKARLQIQDENSRPIATNVITPTSISLNRTTGLKIKILTETSIYPWVIGNFQISATATPYTPFRGMQTVHIPYTLRGQGDVRDTIEYIGGNRWRHTQRLGVKVFDGTEILNASTGSSNEEYFGVYTLFENAAVATSNRQGYCSHGGVWTLGFLNWASVGSGFIYNVNPNHFLRLPRTIVNNVDEFRAFLIAEHVAGTPWTVEYELAEPIITYFTAPAPQTYYPYTQIYTTATVQPTLEGKIRVWEA